MYNSQAAAKKGVVTHKETVVPRECQKFTSLEYPYHLQVLLDLSFDGKHENTCPYSDRSLNGILLSLSQNYVIIISGSILIYRILTPYLNDVFLRKLQKKCSHQF